MTDAEKFEGFKRQYIDDNERQYGAEARERYGNEAVDQSNAKLKGMTPAQFARMEALGAEVRDLGILADKAEVVRAALQEAAGTADLVVTSGGASVGEEDHVKAVVGELGSVDLWKLALKPGKPLALGRIGTTPFLGLPGNPVSAMVTFMLVGRPLVLRLSGAESAPTPRCLVVAGFEFKKKPGRREFLRARLATGPDGRPVAHKFPSDSSGVLTSMVEADGLVDMPIDATTIRDGDMVEFLPFTGLFA